MDSTKPCLRRALLMTLVVGNSLWAGVCVVLLVRYGGQASVFGLLQFIGEGAFVVALAVREWRNRAFILG